MSQALKKYSIVKFSDGLQVVPSCWLNDNKSMCIWPDHIKSQNTLNKLLEGAQYPSNVNTWKSYEVEKWYAGANEWTRAQEKLVDSMYNSEILDSDEYTDEEMRRRLKAIRRENSRRNYSSDEEHSLASLNTENNSISKKRKTFENMKKIMPSLPKSPRISVHSTKGTADNNIQDEQPCHSRTLRQSPSDMLLYQNSTEGSLSFQHIFTEDYKQNKEYESEISFRKFMMESAVTLMNDNKKIIKLLETQSARWINTNSIIDDSDDEDIMLPMCSDEQLHEFEKRLQEKPFFQKLCQRLKASGGQKLSLVTGVVIGKLMADELAVKYSWQGRKGKKPLHKLQQFAKLVRKTVQMICPSSSEKEIEEAAGLWLSQASTRLKRAAARN